MLSHRLENHEARLSTQQLLFLGESNLDLFDHRAPFAYRGVVGCNWIATGRASDVLALPEAHHDFASTRQRTAQHAAFQLTTKPLKSESIPVTRNGLLLTF